MSDQQPGLALRVNGIARTLRVLSVLQTSEAVLPVWTADVDGALGCSGTLEGAILFAARAAENGEPSETEVSKP